MTTSPPQPIRTRIVLWSFLAMVVLFGASVFCFFKVHSTGELSPWQDAGIVFGMLATLAIAAFLVAIIIRIVEWSGRKARRRIEVGDEFE